MRILKLAQHNQSRITCHARSLAPLTRSQGLGARWASSSSKPDGDEEEDHGDFWTSNRVNAFVGHSFPDFIEGWNRTMFKKVGYGLAATTGLTAALTAAMVDLSSVGSLGYFFPSAALGATTAGYWIVGNRDVKQSQHAVRRNYPVLGNFRYIMETIRPEIRQYIVESDLEGRPFDRMRRAQVYQRAKNVDDTIALGTRKNLYDINTEWACHSMFPKKVDPKEARHTIGTKEYGTTKPYSSSILNISAMSYGAISDNAILALNTGARLGNFSHNTGEGGVSKFHREGGGDLVWNVGTGYFGCGTGSSKRVFDATLFKETIEESDGQVKMIEIKLSQGAKPGHGGLLPKSKITEEIANARKLPFPPIADCHSPANHSAFSNHVELVEFVAHLRELSGGLPVGIKMCVGQPGEFAGLCRTIHEMGIGPDFFTIDGAEGGTGAAPPEFSDSIGLPLEEGLVLARNMLLGANLRDKIQIIASGRVTSGFSVTRNLAMGADVTNSARGFMLSLGCIQALKCNTNHCPTGIATQDKDLMFGLDPREKTVRVLNYQAKTVKAACEIIGSMGYTCVDDVSSHDIMRRIRTNEVRTLSEHFPLVPPGSLLTSSAPERLQSAWDSSSSSASGDNLTVKRWVY